MDFHEVLAQRRSVRKYVQKSVSSESIAAIIKAATQAPTAGNLQEWRFIVITDDSFKQKVAAACEDQTWMEQAGVLIVVCTDNKDMERFYGERGKLVYAPQDAAAAAENMLLQATALGLASCWVSAFDMDKVKEVLALPDFVVPHLVVVLGHSEEKGIAKYHFKIEDVVHLNQYGKRAVEYPEMGEIIKGLVEKGKKTIGKLKKKIHA